MTFYDYVMQFIEGYDHTLNAEKTVIRYCFYIKNLCENLSPDFKTEINRDINFLVNDRDYLLDLELKIHSYFQSIYKNKFSFILKILSYYASISIDRASSFNIGDNEFRCIELYAVNRKLTDKLINLLSDYYPKLSPLSQKTHFKLLRKVILDSKEFGNAVSLEELANNIKKNYQLSRSKIATLSILHGEKVVVEMLGVPHDITKYYRLNPIALLQYKKIQKKITSSTELKRFTTFSTVLNNYLIKYPKDKDYFRKHGLLALVENDFEILLKIRNYTTTKIFNYFVYIVEILTDKDFDYSKYDHKCLYIENNYGRPYSIRLEPLYKKSERFASEFYDLFKAYLAKIKYHTHNEVSVRSYVTTLKKIFIHYFDKEALDEHGINLLFTDNCRHFRAVKTKIYEDRLQNKIAIATQQNNYRALKLFCEITKQPYLKDFDESFKQAPNDIAKQSTANKSYSEHELMDLLNHLIKAIKRNKGDYSKLLVVFFALIQIITGMNISTLCTLKDTEEQFKVDDKNPNIYYLSFIKKRSGNNTETYTYFKKTEDKTIYLFLYIRDVLRKKVIELATNKNFKTDYFFVFLGQNNELKNATFDNIGAKVRELLQEVGCNSIYDSKRMRKPVSNKIYKIVLKKFSVYRELVKHDFDVFVRHYEEINTVKTNDVLAQATKSLEIYLKKENICLDEPEIKSINPITEELKDDNIIQFTPLGNCSDNPTDNTPICSDYLACLFCKNFSIVNSEAQIHKLLDFKNICITQMIENSSRYNSQTTTAKAIKEFETRVNYILNLLRNSNPQLYNLAEINYEPNQYFSL